MKQLMKLCHLFVLSCTLVAIISCSDDEKRPSTTITIAGKLVGLENNPIKISGLDGIASDRTDMNGDFVIKFEAEETDYFTFNTDKLRYIFYLSPGDSIFLETTEGNFITEKTISGSKANENYYLAQREVVLTTHNVHNPMELYKNGKEDYFLTKDTIQSKIDALLADLKSKENIDGSFWEIESAFPIYQMSILDAKFPDYYRYINKISLEDEIDFPEDEINAKIQALDFSNPKFLKINAFVELLDQMKYDSLGAKFKRSTRFKDVPNGYFLASLEVIDSVFLNEEVKEHMKFLEIQNFLRYGSFLEAKVYVDSFLVSNAKPKFKNSLKALNAKWEPVMPGKNVPDFSFVSHSGDSTKLSDLRGKLIYLDIWATWCGPCIREHPHWNTMMEEYIGKDIEFVSISIDNSKAPWEKMVTDKQMKGRQWYADNAWKSELAQHFMINSIPRFILLDKEGKVIDPSAARPSGNIREVVDKHLTGV